MDKIKEFLHGLTDEEMSKLSFSLPFGVRPKVDADGFSVGMDSDKEELSITRQFLQQQCWEKFNKNPQVNTSVRGLVGRIVGDGFEVASENRKVHETILEVEMDWRNRLHSNWRAYLVRAFVEGELFLVFTVHGNGFIEVDFLDPAVLADGGDDETGIIFHPTKKTLPLLYLVSDGTGIVDAIPSIFVAYDPNLLTAITGHKDYKTDLLAKNKTDQPEFETVGGFKRFVVAWDRGYVTRRSLSHLRTVLEWLNHYENLKKYEIDHKKACGAYAWVCIFESMQAFRDFIGLTEEERKATGLMQPIIPGSRLFTPPGLKFDVKNPNLPSLSNQDSDILQMMTSGLNEASDVTTGTVGGTYASVKATRGPMADRTKDEREYFRRFYIHDFWRAVFFLKHKVAGFPEFIVETEVISFEEGEAVLGKVKYRPEEKIEISFPISETSEIEAFTRAILGSKHGPLPESIGVPPSKCSATLGFGCYGRNRLRKATEDKKYPKLVYSIDSDSAESIQETTEGERPKDQKGKPDKPAASKEKPAVPKEKPAASKKVKNK